MRATNGLRWIGSVLAVFMATSVVCGQHHVIDAEGSVPPLPTSSPGVHAEPLGRSLLRPIAPPQALPAPPQPDPVAFQGTRSTSGTQPLKPVVTPLERRDLETPDAPLRTEREGRERDPISTFQDSITGTDAIVEVVVGQGRLLTTKQPISQVDGVAVVAVGDPTVIDFEVLPSPRTLRITGNRVGVTDLTIVTADDQSYSYEIHVMYDLPLITAQLRQIFPDALIRLSQLREHVVVEGQARSSNEVSRIVETLSIYLQSVQTRQSRRSNAGAGRRPSRASVAPPPQPGDEVPGSDAGEEGAADAQGGFSEEQGGRPNTTATFIQPQIINLMEVPSLQQVMLKVQIAELDRRAVREIGADLLYSDGSTFLQSIATGTGNLVGVFDSGNFAITLNALRRNSIVTVLAEPNLVTLSGHTATFQSGGEFAVPVGSISNLTPSVEFKPFGVLLNFTPFVQDDEVIRLQVQPEVSTIDETLSVSIVEGGDAVPGLRTRNAATTVDLRQGQTLAIAGLLNRDTSASSSRVPLIGDLPYLGVLFSDTRHNVNEQELLVVVTPYLISPMDAEQRPPLPGQEILEPNDLELYFLNRIEGRTGRPHRSTTNWDNPFCPRQCELEQDYVCGPFGFEE